MKSKKRMIVLGLGVLLAGLIALGGFWAAKATGLILPAAAENAVQPQIPMLLNYQGVLTDENGLLLSGTVTMTLRLYTSLTGSDPLWQETQSTEVERGLFSLYLGSQNPLHQDLFSNQGLYLGIAVGQDAEMQPRALLASVPYAISAHQSACTLHDWYLDTDRDYWGDSQILFRSCDMPPGYSWSGFDCNDADPAIHPFAVETCDEVDNDCDGEIDEGANCGVCDLSYLPLCIPPPPPDLDCSDILYTNFAAEFPDPHNFDSNADGFGCGPGDLDVPPPTPPPYPYPLPTEPPYPWPTVPPEPPPPAVTATVFCDMSYRPLCIPPPPPDLNCSDIPYTNFAVEFPDPHSFDSDGDGIGCEPGDP